MHSHCKHGMTELLRSKITFFANSKMAAALAVTKMQRQGFFLNFALFRLCRTITPQRNYQVHILHQQGDCYIVNYLCCSHQIFSSILNFISSKSNQFFSKITKALASSLFVAENRLNGRMMMKQTFQLMNTRLETALRGKITKQQ